MSNFLHIQPAVTPGNNSNNNDNIFDNADEVHQRVVENNNVANDGESTRSSQYEEDQQEVVRRPARDYKDAVNRANANDPSLTTIDLCDINIGDAVSNLASALTHNTHVVTLDLWNNEIDPKGAAALASMLRGNATLRKLTLVNNNIEDDGAATLASALRENATLQGLYLYKNNIGPIGASLLAQALKENATLQELSLHYNDVGDDGVVSLAEALKENSSLQTLSLGSNNIGDEGAVLLASAMEVNATLTSLEVHTNEIDQSLQEKLDGFLARNEAIIRINKRKNDSRVQHDMLSSEGLVDALVELNDDKDIFESVVFLALQEIPEVMDRFNFMGAQYL